VPLLAIVFGALLIALGLEGYYDFGGLLGVGRQQPTALIPTYFGGGLVLCGLAALAGGAARKHAMHLAALVAAFGMGGALYRPVQALRAGTFDFNQMPTRLQLAMAVLCLAFVLLCVQSFVNARRRRAAGGG
jgi:hypothetical protein